MGYSSYEDAKAEANRILLEKRSCVIVKKSSDKFIKRSYTSKKERFSGFKDLQQSGNDGKYGNHYAKDHEKIQNAKKLDEQKDITHKSCDREGRKNSHSSQDNNQYQRKLRHAYRRLSKLKQKILEINEDDQKPSTCRESRRKHQKHRREIAVEHCDQKHKNRHAGNGSLSLKPKTRNVGSQMNFNTDEKRTDYGAFGDHSSNLEKKAFFKPDGRDESPIGVKDFITAPLAYGGYEQIVNICNGCSNPYNRCLSSGACRRFLCNPQRCSTGYERVPCPEYCRGEYSYLNPQAPQGHTQNCVCKQGHYSNCCQCMKKELQASESYKRRATDLQTQHFYNRKSESRSPSKSPSPDKSKSVKHQANLKLVQNKGNTAKSKEDYEGRGLNVKKDTDIKVKKDTEHFKEKILNKNDNKRRGLFKKNEKSTSELSERFDNILIETLGQERWYKLIQILDYVSEETDDKPLTASHKKEKENVYVLPVSGAETFTVTSKKRVCEVYLSKQTPTTNSSTSPRDYSQDTSFCHSYKSDEYNSETLRMLRKMKIMEYKANTPTTNRKVDHEINRPREEIEEKPKSQDKSKRYDEYIKKYKNHDSQMYSYDKTVQTEHDKDVNDTFEEQCYADGPASSRRDYPKEQYNVYKSNEHTEAKKDFKHDVGQFKYSKDHEYHSGTSRGIQEFLGNKEKTSTSFSTEKSFSVYKEDISIKQSYLTGSGRGKGNVDELVMYKTKRRQNVQAAGNNADNVDEKRRENSMDVLENRYKSGRPLHDLNLPQGVYEIPRMSQNHKGNRNISKFSSDKSQHINNDAYYKIGIPSESSSQVSIRSNGRNDSQVDNIKIETSKYSNSNRNSADTAIHDVTEEIKNGRSYVISPRPNEYKEITHKVEGQFTNGTTPKDLFTSQNKSAHVSTAAAYGEAFTGNKHETMIKSNILEKQTIPNKKPSKIEVSKDKGISSDDTMFKDGGENTKLNNEETLSTSHSIDMEEAKDAMNCHFGRDNKIYTGHCENHFPDKITKDKDFIVESNKLADAAGIDYSTCLQCSDGKSGNKYHQETIRNSSLDTLRCLRQNGALEDESLKALAEELLTYLNSNYVNSRVNYRVSEDKSTLTRQEKRTIEVQCSDRGMFEGYKSGKNAITELAKSTESSVMETPSKGKVVDRLKEHMDTNLKLESGSFHQDATTQNLPTKIYNSNQEVIGSTTDKCEEQESRYKTIQNKTPHHEVRSSQESKQQMVTHVVNETPDKNAISSQHSYYLHNKTEEVKSSCEQKVTMEAGAESKFGIARNIAPEHTDGFGEQSPSLTVGYQNFNHMEPEPVEDFVCKESLKAEAINQNVFDITRDIPSDHAEYLFEQYPTSSKYTNFKPTENSEPKTESNYEYTNFKSTGYAEPKTESNYENTNFKHTEYAKPKTKSNYEYTNAKPTGYSEPQSESHDEYFELAESSDFCENRSLTHTTRETAPNCISDISKIRKYPKAIGSPVYSSNASKLPQDKSPNQFCCPAEQMQQFNTAKRKLPSFHHCPCMLNTYVNLLKTYYNSNKRAIASENLVNC